MPRINTSRIVLNKVSPPRLPKTLERARLFSALDDARGRPIIWITAPAGMGKTTLAASYLKIRKLNTLWFQIDEGDADPATLFQYLGVAATTIGGRKKSALPNLTPEYLPSLSTFARRFFEILYGRLKSQGILVLDNFQELPIDAPTQELLVLAGEILPPKMNLMIVSRKDPPPAFAKLLANQSIALINAESLLLTSIETVAICRLHNPSVRPTTLKTQAQHIHERTRGWIAGTILLLESEKQNPGSSQETGQPPDVVFNYLAKEVFETFSEEIQHVLLKTAFFPSLTTEMAETITGLQQASTLLNKLYQSRYFVERHHSPSQFYRYHPLFQAFLQNLAHERLSKVTLQALLNKTAQLLESAGQPEEAMKLWQSNGDNQNCIKLALSQAPLLASQGRFQVLQQWIENLPAERLETEPWLIYWMGVCRFPFSPHDAKRHFIQAHADFRTLQNLQGQLAAYCGVVQVITNLWQDLSELDPWLEQVSHLQPMFDQLPQELQANLASTLVQALIWRRPQDPTIDLWIDHILKNFKHIPNDFQRGLLIVNLSSFFCIRGQQDKALQMLQDFPVGQGNNQHPAEQILFLQGQALTLWYTGNIEKAHKFLEAMKALATKHQTWVLAGCHVYTHQIYCGLPRQDLPAARAALKGLEPLIARLPGVANVHFQFMAGWVAMAENNYSNASTHLKKGLKTVLTMGTPFPEAEVRLALAEVLLEFHQQKEAAGHITKGLDIAHLMASPYLEFKGLCLEARLALHQGQQSVSLEKLKRAIGVGKRYNIVITSFWRPSVMADLCAKALTHNIEIDYVQDLIRQRRLIPEHPPLTIPHWPWAVKISTLGRLAIEIDGILLEWSRKAQRRPLQLLKCLIALGGREIPETQLTEKLWPDADGDFAHQNFATTLHRLRKLLKYEEAILLKDKLVSLNPRYCWIDIWAWDALVSIIQTSGSSVENPSDLNQALAIYQGSFLPDEPDEPWAMWLRKRMQSQYLRLLETHIEMLRSPEHKPAVCQILEHACQIEPATRPIFEHYSQGLFKPQSKEEV